MTDGFERGRLFNTAWLVSVLADQHQLEESCAERLAQLGRNATTWSRPTKALCVKVV
jgi:hypothetical protein